MVSPLRACLLGALNARAASVNIEGIVRNLDIDTLQDNLINIAFCDIEAEDLRNVDPNFIKMFKLSQLMLEYVLFHQVRGTSPPPCAGPCAVCTAHCVCSSARCPSCRRLALARGMPLSTRAAPFGCAAGRWVLRRNSSHKSKSPWTPA